MAWMRSPVGSGGGICPLLVEVDPSHRFIRSAAPVHYQVDPVRTIGPRR